MIFRRYGSAFHSVELNFDSKALNEIGFRRDREREIPVGDLESGYERSAVHELTAEAVGDVQDHTEAAMLSDLEGQILCLRDGLAEGELLVVENDQGHDWPKTRQRTDNVIVKGENKLRFTYTIAPAIRVAVYRPVA